MRGIRQPAWKPARQGDVAKAGPPGQGRALEPVPAKSSSASSSAAAEAALWRAGAPPAHQGWMNKTVHLAVLVRLGRLQRSSKRNPAPLFGFIFLVGESGALYIYPFGDEYF